MPRDLKTLLANVNEATRKRNPNLFGVGELPATERKSRPLETLEPQKSRTKQSVGRMVAGGGSKLRIAIIAHRHRLIDSGNLVASFKAVQDAIAAWFRVDDYDSRVKWEYSQIRTAGQEGLSVKIESS